MATCFRFVGAQYLAIEELERVIVIEIKFCFIDQKALRLRKQA